MPRVPFPHRQINGLLFLFALGLAGTNSAQAAEMCNETSFVIELASGWPIEGGVALQGWERIRPGECADTAQSVELYDDQPIFYYAKTSSAYLGGVREWRGNVPLCVDEVDFEVVANTRCAALGLASRDFMIREGDDRERTVLVEPLDFGTRSNEAGLQRLLQSAGYAIGAIDGYAGPGTRRAVSQFLADSEMSSRPSDERLMDALEARALERNASSGLTICNASNYDISTALGHRQGDTWESRGWWRLHGGECARMIATRLETASTFYYAERINAGERRTLIGGEEAFCSAPSRFLAEHKTHCADRGYSETLFRRIPEPDDGGVHITLDDRDFESGSNE